MILCYDNLVYMIIKKWNRGYFFAVKLKLKNIIGDGSYPKFSYIYSNI